MQTAFAQSKQNKSNQRARHWDNNAAANVPPALANPDDARLKDECNESLLQFLLTCFPAAFCLEMSPIHIEIIKGIQERIEKGGLKAIAMPRGSGKTSLLLRAALWAILTGRKRYVCIVAADEMSAVSNLGTIKTEINHNPMIERLYGRETWCIRQLGNEPRRCATPHQLGTAPGPAAGAGRTPGGARCDERAALLAARHRPAR